MKIRNGFVSNSSSTCFTFLFKTDDKQSIYGSLFRKKNEFSGIDCNPEDVVSSICNHIEHLGLFPIDMKIRQINEDINFLKKDIYENQFAAIREIFNDAVKRGKYLNDYKKEGFSHYVEICYGDTEGDEAGTEVSIGMDMNAFFINIENNDFAVLKETNR